MLQCPKENVNIGLLGHVDCGKTSLAKALSSQTGTACFDKSPQSQERGITLDLGFSSFQYESFSFTVVDCPGHASLFKTVLCGAQIIDVFILVIDAAKGMQAQTAECWILAQILAQRVVFVLNKVELLDSIALSKLTEKMKSFLSNSRFKDAPLVCTSTITSVGVTELKDALVNLVNRQPIVRPVNQPFLFAVDHCFNLKGQGTVLTGTVLSGSFSNKQSIFIPSLNLTKKVKSMQSFKKTLDSISAGDRAGICVAALEAELIERTLVCAPETPLPSSTLFLLKIQKVKHFKSQLHSKSRIHITILNETLLAKQITFVKQTLNGWEFLDDLEGEEGFVVVELERPVLFVENATVVAARLDFEPSMKQCRIAFHGQIIKHSFSFNDIPLYTVKERSLTVDRFVDEGRLIASFSGERKTLHYAAKFVGMKVELIRDSEVVGFGVVDSTFGSSGKVNISHNCLLSFSSKTELSLRLRFAKLLFQSEKKTFQLQ